MDSPIVTNKPAQKSFTSVYTTTITPTLIKGNESPQAANTVNTVNTPFTHVTSASGSMKKFPTMSNVSDIDIDPTENAIYVCDVSDVSDASPNVSSKSKQASPAGTPLGRIIKANGVESVLISCTLPERGGVSS